MALEHENRLLRKLKHVERLKEAHQLELVRDQKVLVEVCLVEGVRYRLGSLVEYEERRIVLVLVLRNEELPGLQLVL